MNHISINLPFAHCFVLNERGDESRWNAFISENGWNQHASRLSRIATCDWRRVQPPKNWQGGGPRWSRLRALASVLEHCLDRGIATAMVVQDSARLVPGGNDLFQEFVEQMPVDWNLLALGGTHCSTSKGLPTQVRDSVYRPFCVADPCAFMWRGYPMLRKLYRFVLKSCGSLAGPRDYFEVKRPSSRGIYVPADWVFQTSDSDVPSTSVSRKGGAASLWNDSIPQTVVAVLGHYRGGSSCVAGVLHRLGVSMGEQLLTPDTINPTGYFECVRLNCMCRRFFDHPSMSRRLPDDQMVGLLRQWAFRRSEDNRQATFMGAKHPALSCLGEEMRRAWPRQKYIVVDRPHHDIVSSILRTGWGWSREEAAINVEILAARRQEFLDRCDTSQYIRIEFDSLRSRPEVEIRRITSHLDLQVEESVLQAAIAHVVPGSHIA